MAETGCLKDGHFQNLEVAGNTELGIQNLNIKGINSTENNPVVLTLQTGETSIDPNETIGRIDFQAPETTGTAAEKVCASIEAVSEDTFDETSNATKLSFKTAAAEEAVEKMFLSSDGQLTLPSGQANFRGGTTSTGTLVAADVDGKRQTSLVQSFPDAAGPVVLATTTITIEHILTGVIIIQTAGASASQNPAPLPTAASIVGGLNNPKIGDCIFFSIINEDGGDLTIEANPSNTTLGGSGVIASLTAAAAATPSGSALFRLRIVNVDNPAVNVERIA